MTAEVIQLPLQGPQVASPMQSGQTASTSRRASRLVVSLKRKADKPVISIQKGPAEEHAPVRALPDLCTQTSLPADLPAPSSAMPQSQSPSDCVLRKTAGLEQQKDIQCTGPATFTEEPTVTEPTPSLLETSLCPTVDPARAADHAIKEKGGDGKTRAASKALGNQPPKGDTQDARHGFKIPTAGQAAPSSLMAEPGQSHAEERDCPRSAPKMSSKPKPPSKKQRAAKSSIHKVTEPVTKVSAQPKLQGAKQGRLAKLRRLVTGSANLARVSAFCPNKPQRVTSDKQKLPSPKPAVQPAPALPCPQGRLDSHCELMLCKTSEKVESAMEQAVDAQPRQSAASECEAQLREGFKNPEQSGASEQTNPLQPSLHSPSDCIPTQFPPRDLFGTANATPGACSPSEKHQQAIRDTTPMVPDLPSAAQGQHLTQPGVFKTAAKRSLSDQSIRPAIRPQHPLLRAAHASQPKNALAVGSVSSRLGERPDSGAVFYELTPRASAPRPTEQLSGAKAHQDAQSGNTAVRQRSADAVGKAAGRRVSIVKKVSQSQGKIASSMRRAVVMRGMRPGGRLSKMPGRRLTGRRLQGSLHRGPASTLHRSRFTVHGQPQHGKRTPVGDPEGLKARGNSAKPSSQDAKAEDLPGSKWPSSKAAPIGSLGHQLG